MRIGLVVDSACDLPLQYLQQNEVTILPITVRIGEAVLAAGLAGCAGPLRCLLGQILQGVR